MGEVYRARDTKLNRDVALKVLPDSFATDPDRLARFQREAQVLASLNHPNIAHIHGLEDSGGVRALVMELVEGEDLAQRITRGAILIDEALPIAKQIAEALEAAHEQGIIHRDLKPANIKVRNDGTVKVLDFGLAKAMEPVGLISSNLSQSPTITTPAMTQAGMILGTAAYMAPEQARGKVVDRRADIWAFGCVLYEMLTRRRAFSGQTVPDTIGAVLGREPDWTLLPPHASASVRRVLQRCLEKDPRRRLRDIGDARLELDVTDAVSMQPEAPTTRQKWPLVLAGAAVAGALISVFLWLSARAAPSSVRSGSPVRFTLTFDGLTTDESVPAPSPDGTHAVLGARDAEGHQSLWLRTMDSGTVQRIGGTDDGSSPFWSKDGHWIGFYADGKLKKVSVSGGSPQTVVPVPIDYPGSQGASWNGSGEIIFTTSNRGGLSVVHDPGGTARALTTLDRARTENSHRHPQFLPDGVHFIFMARCNLRENDALYLGRLDTGETHRVLSVRSNVQ